MFKKHLSKLYNQLAMTHLEARVRRYEKDKIQCKNLAHALKSRPLTQKEFNRYYRMDANIEFIRGCRQNSPLFRSIVINITQLQLSSLYNNPKLSSNPIMQQKAETAAFCLRSAKKGRIIVPAITPYGSDELYKLPAKIDLNDPRLRRAVRKWLEFKSERYSKLLDENIVKVIKRQHRLVAK